MSFLAIRRTRPLYTDKAEIVSALGLLLFISGCFLALYYHQHLPNLPDAALGRTYELDMHGRSSYMTQGESATLHLLIIGGWLIAIAGNLPKVMEFRKKWKQAR